MKNKLLLLLLLILILTLFSVLLLFYFKKIQYRDSRKIGQGDAGNGNIIDTEKKSDAEYYEYSMNQDSKQIPTGYSDVTEYFNKMNADYYSDCKLIDFEGEDPFKMDDQEFIDFYQRALDEILTLINYDLIKSELDYYQGVNPITDEGFCMFVNIEKNGEKIIYYLDRVNNLKEVKLNF
jgi:hypothetical protein